MSRLGYTNKITVDQVYLNACLEFAKATARKAGNEVLLHFRSNLQIQNKLESSFDPVTVADKRSEEVIRGEIEQHYPQHGIYGEEFGYKVGNGLTWVIDPIDGTRGFVTGMLHWGILIALFDGEKPLTGVVYQPYTDELFFGTDKGSWLEGRSIPSRALGTSSCDDLDKAFLATTDEDLFSGDQLEGFRAIKERVRIGRFGGDCYSYCALAMGFIDIALDPGLQPYDIQALIPIIRGAGGIITTFEGGNPSLGGHVVASANSVLHEQVLDLLNK